MKERPILMNGAMVRATLADDKTQTRRIVKLQPPENARSAGVIFSTDPDANGTWSWLDDTNLEWASIVGDDFRCPYGQPGDRLWVRETFGLYGDKEKHVLHYRATHHRDGNGMGWKPSIHMPRWASRINLEITSVRVERLNDISEADAIAEGTPGGHGAIPDYTYAATPVEHYRWLWEQINGVGSWNVNPWVWVIEFKRLEKSA